MSSHNIVFSVVLIIVAIGNFQNKLALADSRQSMTGMVTKISDGDTFHFFSNGKNNKIRLAYIDCPEQNQPKGDAATSSLRDSIMGKAVEINVVDTDRYGRLVAEVFVNDKNINLDLVRSGKCYVYPKYAKGQQEYFDAEELAKQERLGVHQSYNAINPWDWRRM